MATTITKDTKEITYAGSPQFISATDVGNVAIAQNFFIYLKIWTGLKASVPSSNTIELFLPAIPTGQELESNVTFEISKFITEHLDDDEYITSSGSNYNGGAAVWYEYTVSADNGSAVVTSTTRLATSGVGRVEDGSNPGTTVSTENGKVFGNHSNNLIVDPNGSYLIPVYIGDTSTNDSVVTQTQTINITSLGFTLNSTESSEQVAYIPINITTFGSEWLTGNKIKYSIADSNGNTALRGLSFFSGNSAYMNLGKVPLLNSGDSYVSMKFKAYDWSSYVNPFGYYSAGSDRFDFNRGGGNEYYSLQAGTPIEVSPSNYPTPDNYQSFLVFVADINDTELEVEVDGNYTIIDTLFTPRAESGIDFYIGARNNGGVADNFTDVVFTELTFYNGVTTKTFNHANNWNGAINYGGNEVVSYDNGETWDIVNGNQYSISIECSKGEPMALKYVNFSGVVDVLPINGIGKESITIEKTNYNNSVLDSDYNYDPLKHINKTFVSNGKTRFDMSTGWIYEATNVMVEELLLSKYVWLETLDMVYPIQINTKALQKINRVWSNQVDYSFSTEVAQPIINNIL